MLDILHTIYIIVLIVCIVSAIVYISVERDDTQNRESQQQHSYLSTKKKSSDKPSYTLTFQTMPTFKDTRNVLPSYVESRSVLIEVEDVKQQPYEQRTNNVLSPCAPLPTNVQPSLYVVEHTPASSCPRVNFWCSPLGGLYV